MSDFIIFDIISALAISGAALTACEALKENIYSRKVTILANIYRRIEETSRDRDIVLGNKYFLSSINSKEKFKDLREREDLYYSVKRVLNCYEYIGLIVKQGLIEEDLILQKESQTIITIWETTRNFVEFYRKPRCQSDTEFCFYAMYLQWLYTHAKKYQNKMAGKCKKWQDEIKLEEEILKQNI